MKEPREVSQALGIPFSDEQLAAITAPLEPAVVIAGAGSGKTTVMAARVVWLVGSGQVAPEEVLGLTFTRKAAGELAQRIRSALSDAGVVDLDGSDEAGEQVVMTYDAFAGRIVADHGMRLGYESDPRLLTGASRYRIAAKVVSAHTGEFHHLSRLKPHTLVDRLLALDSDLSSHLVNPDQLSSFTARHLEAVAAAPRNRGRIYASMRDAEAAALERLELVQLVWEYRDLKKQLGNVEFSDQMAAAARLVQEVPGVSDSLRRQFRVVLLDEYQDTSSAQAQLLRGIFSGDTVSIGRGHPVTAVGDPFQAIYGWRGAAAANILSFAGEFPRQDGSSAATYSLTVNRRSGTRILDTANVLAERLRDDPTLGSDAVTELVAPPGKEPGEVCVGVFTAWTDEVEWIAESIARQHEQGADGAATWSDVAVLVRRNAEIPALYAALTSRDIPVEIVGLGGLLGLPEVADVVSTLRLLGDVTANPDAVRLLTGSRWRLGKADMALLGQRAASLAAVTADVPPGDDPVAVAIQRALAAVDPADVLSLLDAVADPGDLPYGVETRGRLAQFAREMEYLRSHADEPVLDLVRRVIGVLGLDVELQSSPDLVRRRAANQLAAFVDAVAAYVDVDGDASLLGLLSYLDAEVDHGAGLEQAVPTQSDSVKLLTAHRSKGLEWNVVYVPGLVDTVFPNVRVTGNWVGSAQTIPSPLRGDADAIPQLRDTSDKGVKEFAEALREQALRSEDRLAYVAVTRARRTVVATAHWWRPGRTRMLSPSPYLETIRGMDPRVVHDADQPDPAAGNPLLSDPQPREWPASFDHEAEERRREVGESVRVAMGTPAQPPAITSVDVAQTVSRWDREAAALLEELRQGSLADADVHLPLSLSASQLMLAASHPDLFAARLARPMPKPPAPAAAGGTRFHTWVEQRFGQVGLFDIDDVLDAPGPDHDDEDLRELCAAFAAGQFGDRPPEAVEVPFSFLLPTTAGGIVLRGRIDAVYRQPDGTWLVVDWKTSRTESADPLQLAVYRLAWARQVGVDVDQVQAAFHYVRTDTLDLRHDLPTPDQLGALVGSLGS